MSERAIIERKLQKKTQEIQSLERKLDAAKVYIQALQDVLRDIDNEDDDDQSEKSLRRGSTVAHAREVIMDAGCPVYIDDILKRLGKEITRESKASLAGSLAAYVRKGEIFSRPAPSTFGLIELGHTDEESTENRSEPPAGFGGANASSNDNDDDEIPF